MSVKIHSVDARLLMVHWQIRQQHWHTKRASFFYGSAPALEMRRVEQCKASAGKRCNMFIWQQTQKSKTVAEPR